LRYPLDDYRTDAVPSLSAICSNVNVLSASPKTLERFKNLTKADFDSRKKLESVRRRLATLSAEPLAQLSQEFLDELAILESLAQLLPLHIQGNLECIKDATQDRQDLDKFHSENKILPVSSPPDFSSLPAVKVIGYPELLIPLHKYSRIYNAIFHSSVALVLIHDSLSSLPFLESKSAASAFLAAASDAIALPWPSPADARAVLSPVLSDSRKIHVASDRNASGKLHELALVTTHKFFPWFHLPRDSQSSRALVLSVWKYLLAGRDDSCLPKSADRVLLELLVSMAGPLDKIAELDWKINHPIYPALAHQAILECFPRDFLAHLFDDDMDF